MIDVFKVKDKGEGQIKAHDILKMVVDSKTLLALSGGTTVDYGKMIVKPANILPGAICVVDERYGERQFHKDSNELMMKQSGLIDFLKSKKIPFHGVQFEDDMGSTACDYDGLVAGLFKRFPKKVGVMGVGRDLHTAGIFPHSDAAHSADYVVAEKVEGKFAKRITLTLRALGEFTNFIIMMFGEEKKEALAKMLDPNENDMQKYPAIFYRKAKIKSYVVTDVLM
ncbi:hypothetical protein A3B51_01135 [Candidatus Curtissbacteria bacterium RIFCSPLOWO2_01_FULL_41_18]|uniref:Glucosamine/galactosamine-6-phosphate isomerase domain-containing protein n=1 Tax=Candidatus Curtissbacteria bacterium RIFCSPLOWO2_01_FULL_41_18 TaxID=1797727 RepID=A0A1F5HHK5_9BACT|nr:MAG: hypothetical protein A3B51_01135 [Candidatus Curtissbacteria bacterium RIFCSPLOWO2_01_FULL_41_18]